MAASSRCFLFELDAAEQANPSKKVKFCARVPVIKKYADVSKKEDMEDNRASFLNCVNYMWRNAYLCPKAEKWFEKRLSASAGDGDLFECSTTLKSLDMDWKTGYLELKVKFTRARLEKSCDYDPETVDHIYIFILGGTVLLRFNENVSVKAIMTLLFDTQCVAMKKRFESLGDQCIDENTGNFNWLAFGVYKITFNDAGVATKVLHRSTDTEVAVPSHASFDNTFELLYNFSDISACVVKHPSKISLADYFPNDQGPHAMPLWCGKGFQAKVNTAMDAAAKAHADGVKPVVQESPTKFMAAAQVQKRKENMQKARTALNERKESLTRKRKITLG